MNFYTVELGDENFCVYNLHGTPESTTSFPHLETISGIACSSMTQASTLINNTYLNQTCSKTLKARFSEFVTAAVKDICNKSSFVHFTGPNAVLLDTSALENLGYKFGIRIEREPSKAVTTYDALRNTSFYAQLDQADRHIHDILIQAYTSPSPKLNLKGQGLTALPTALSYIEHITKLNLSRNNITDLPDLSYFKGIKTINLSRNQLRTIPDTVACLSSLVKLDVSYNNLENIPNAAIQCKNITLILHHNPNLSSFPLPFALQTDASPIALEGTQISDETACRIDSLRQKAIALCKSFESIRALYIGANFLDDIARMEALFEQEITDCLKPNIPGSYLDAIKQADLIVYRLRKRGFIMSDDFGSSRFTKYLPSDFFAKLVNSLMNIKQHQVELRRSFQFHSVFQLKIRKSKIRPSYSIYFDHKEGVLTKFLHFGKSGLIDSGSSKVVTRALNLTTYEPLALAKTPDYTSMATELKFADDLSLCQSVLRPVEFFDINKLKGVTEMHVFFPLCAGNLTAFIPTLFFEQKLQIACDIIDPLILMHNHNRVHRDLKTNNILIRYVNGVMRGIVHDFGLAHKVKEVSRIFGTPDALSPTSLYCEAAGAFLTAEQQLKEDVWGVGLILYRMFINANTHRALYKVYKPERYSEFVNVYEKNAKMYRAVAQAYERQYENDVKVYTDPIHKIIHDLMNPRDSERISLANALERIQEIRGN